MKIFGMKWKEETKETHRPTNLGCFNEEGENKPYLFLELDGILFKISEEEIPDLALYYYIDEAQGEQLGVPPVRTVS